MKNIYPGLNRILVKQKELPDTGSILASSSNIFSYGEIVAVGALKDDIKFKDGTFKEGNNVYFLSQAGILMEIPQGTFKLLSISDILIGEQNG